MPRWVGGGGGGGGGHSVCNTLLGFFDMNLA